MPAKAAPLALPWLSLSPSFGHSEYEYGREPCPESQVFCVMVHATVLRLIPSASSYPAYPLDQSLIGIPITPANSSPCATDRLALLLIRKSAFAVAGHCHSATAIRGQLAHYTFHDCVEHLEGEILTLM